jgi:squalene-associated FAD-dependent desaturase
MGVGHDGGSGMTRTRNRASVVVVGGGLAGISAAIGLADAGLDVTLLEGRPWLGGATCSFARRGLTIDNGQHVFLRSCVAYRDLLARLGVTASCSLQAGLDLTVLGPETTAKLRRSGLPAPLHLARSLAGYRLLSRAERAKVAAAALALQFVDGTGQPDCSLGDWLARRGQDERARRLVWDQLALSALNVGAERADLQLAASAIGAALLGGRSNADLGIPSVPLSKLHGAPAAALLSQLRVRVRLGVRATAVRVRPAGGYEVQLAHGPQAGTAPAVRAREPVFGAGPAQINATGIVVAVPVFDAVTLMPDGLAAAAATWSRLEPSPVISLHVIYGSRVTRLPFAAVVGAPVHWVVDKTAAAGLHAGQYLAASIRAADAYVDRPAAELRAEFLPVLEQLFPAAAQATLVDFFVTRERRATIAHLPGSQRLRPAAGTGPVGFAVAGAWTDTGWPDSMEGAVRSGLAAAQKLAAELPAPRPASRRAAGSALLDRPVVDSTVAPGQATADAQTAAPTGTAVQDGGPAARDKQEMTSAT